MKTNTFDHFGVMIDCSRNAVMSVAGLKKFLPLISSMGYNTVLLYTEDTYEVEGEPYFGYMRGRYAISEMQELDSFASSLGLEIIPCIQTLAHLNQTFRWGKIPHDCDDILMVDDPRTYELIDRMFSTLSKCFKSRNIHIGMDEAHMLGRGMHLDRYGYEKTGALMKRHLEKVSKLAEKYGYRPQMWSDMFFRPWNHAKDITGEYYIGRTEIPQDVIDSVPENTDLVYWDYYHASFDDYDAMMYNHSQFNSEIWFAGGVWTWTGLCPRNRFSIRNMVPAVDACRKNGIRNLYFTLWGDDGGECSRFAVLPALFYLAGYAQGEGDEQKIKEAFEKKFGISFDEFCLLDEPDNLPSAHNYANPSKYMLYSDCLNDFLDYTVSPGYGNYFADLAEKLSAVSRKSRRYGYLFRTEAKLCRVLSYKYELGIRTRSAYQSGDRKELRRLAKEDYAAVIRLLPELHAAFEKQWFAENNTCGFDVQDMRLGALMQRIKSVRKRILDYAEGKIDRIEELELPILPYGNEEGKAISCNRYDIYGSTNVISH